MEISVTSDEKEQSMEVEPNEVNIDLIKDNIDDIFGKDSPVNPVDNLDHKNELDNLLGSDDEEDEAEKPGNGEDINDKKDKSRNELDDLLGGDDDDDDDDNNKDFSGGNINGLKQENELDQLLGNFSSEVDNNLHSSEKDNIKEKTNLKLKLQKPFRIKESQKRFFVRTPNFIKIHPTLYDSSSHNEEQEKTIYDGSAAIVRYRVKKNEYGDPVLDSNNQPVYESNSRLVQYEDGTYQLIVGKAVFNSKIVPATGCYIFQEQRIIKDDPEDDEDILPDSSCLECIGEAENRMILQPTSLDSETHTRMSLKISEKFKKDNKITIHDYEKIIEKPEVTLALLAKKEEEHIRKEMRQRMQSSEYRSSSYGNESRFYHQSRPSMSTKYLNDESQFDGDDIGALKGSFKGKTAKSRKSISRYDEDEEEDDFIDDDDDEEDEEEDEEGNIDGLINDEEEEDGEDDEEEEEVVNKKKKNKSEQKQSNGEDKLERNNKKSRDEEVEVEDDEDEEMRTNNRKKKVRKTVIDSDDDE